MCEKCLREHDVDLELEFAVYGRVLYVKALGGGVLKYRLEGC